MQGEEKCECRSSKTYDNCKENGGKINPELKPIIDKIAKKEGFSTYNLLVKNVTPDGRNYLGMLTEVTVHDTKSKKKLDLFVKSIIPNAEQLKVINVPEVYCTEMHVYLELSKLLEKFQADAQVPLEERYTFVKCYKESTSEHIIMENMIKQGFTTWNRFDIITLDFAEKAIKLLAKFHALGYVLQEKRPKYFEENIMPLRYALKIDEHFHTYYLNMADNVLEYLKGSTKSKLEKHVSVLFENGERYINDRASTLAMCHGDFRPSNILIKTVEGEITAIVPVDYQILYHGSPLIDLFYFIFGATDREFRRRHLDYLKNLYYDTMKQFLKYFDMDVHKYYPKEEYERLFKERLEYGLFLGMWYLQGNLAKEEDIIDLSTSQISDIMLPKNELAMVRIQELVEEFIEWGYL